jgi:hypothetical protein
MFLSRTIFSPTTVCKGKRPHRFGSLRRKFSGPDSSLVSHLQLFQAGLTSPFNVEHGGLAMQLELHCSHCHYHFTAFETPAADVLERITEQGPWCALGDGETLEDHVSAALIDEETVRCPLCGRPAAVDEESLGRFTREMLANW